MFLILERRPEAGKLLETLPKVSKSWFVAFYIKPIGLIVKWAIILHFRSVESVDFKSHGGSIPAIFFEPNTTKLHIASSVNDKGSFVTRTAKELPLNVWTRVIVMQNKNEAGKYMFRVFVNAKQIQNIQNDNAQEFGNVSVWMVNRSNNAANAAVKNLFYFNLE